MTFFFKQWQSELTQLISDALGEFRSNAEDEMEIFALDCHPWNGVIALAFLTHLELEDAPFLTEAAEMAAWKYYDFGANLTSWRLVSAVASRMRPVYESSENRYDVAREFFQGCAAAVASKPVQDTLATYRLAQGFKITIPHPDNAEEYYPPR
jgi:hypothetical protein